MASPAVGIRVQSRRDRNPPTRQLPRAALAEPRDGAPRNLGAVVDPLRDPSTECMRPPTTNNSTHYACRSSGPYASSAATSPGRRVFPPDRLATCIRHALAEILQRPNPARRHRTYPRVTKRAARNKFPRKMLSHKNIRHRGPHEIQLTRLQS